LLISSFRHFHVCSIGNPIWTLSHCFNKIYELCEWFLSDSIYLHYLTIENFIGVKVGSVLEKIDLEVIGRIKVFHFYVQFIPFFSLSLSLTSLLSWNRLNHLE
jgi:hypothetical protein